MLVSGKVADTSLIRDTVTTIFDRRSLQNPGGWREETITILDLSRTPQNEVL
jgi:hypothetical protein